MNKQEFHDNLVEAVARTLHGYELAKTSGLAPTQEDFEAWREKHSPHWTAKRSSGIEMLQINFFKNTVDGLVGNIMNTIEELDVEG